MKEFLHRADYDPTVMAAFKEGRQADDIYKGVAMTCPTHHAHLTRLEGPLHQAPNHYVCKDCGQQFVVMLEPLRVTVSYGPIGARKREP